MAEWVDAGHAMLLTTASAQLRVVETAAGGFHIEAEPIPGQTVLGEPEVSTLELGSTVVCVDIPVHQIEPVAAGA